MRDLDAEMRYERGLAKWHAENDPAPHLTAAAIAACGLCDAEGYRGTNVCDHVDHAAAAHRGRAACLAAISKLPKDGDQ